MGIRHLRTLVMVADCGGFSSAAERLFVTQSAVSLQMKTLEQEWQVSLFDRSTRPPVLSRKGWSLVPRARALVEEYDALRSSADTAASELVGTLRIGVVPSAATNLLPQVLLQLRQSHPGLTTRAASGLSAELLFKVGQGQLDAAVVTEPDRLDSGLVAELIRQEELKVFAREDMLLPNTEAMLSERPFIRFSGAMGVGRIVEEALRAKAIRVNAIVELDSIEAILTMVDLGLGIAILPERSTVLHPNRSRTALSLTPPIQRILILVARRDYLGQPALQFLLHTFRQIAQAAMDNSPAK